MAIYANLQKTVNNVRKAEKTEFSIGNAIQSHLADKRPTLASIASIATKE